MSETVRALKETIAAKDETIAALRAQVADLKQWRAQDKTASEALFQRVRDHLDRFLSYCEGGGLPSEIRAKHLWVDVNHACGDAVDHSRRSAPPK